ncbi:hypothetical protein BpHYR1_028675 [Brachionus plicatilis]|uniref:Uncharacterized protein n=1 Tax=Brachionus plicatilis TaxID=10195 RepID=A0A3M7T9I0_BRAPC|nr:hypothetical protein BpHYR1_028675 [Brachionus plicatilis]
MITPTHEKILINSLDFIVGNSRFVRFFFPVSLTFTYFMYLLPYKRILNFCKIPYGGGQSKAQKNRPR